MNCGPLRIEVPVDHASFAGHFPGAPLLPGALLLDEVLRRLPAEEGAAAHDAPTIEVTAVRFVSPALPGESLDLRHEAAADGSWRFELRAGERLVMNGRARRVAGASR